MHCTGHTSTQARSFTSMHASVITAMPATGLSLPSGSPTRTGVVWRLRLAGPFDDRAGQLLGQRWIEHAAEAPEVEADPDPTHEDGDEVDVRLDRHTLDLDHEDDAVGGRAIPQGGEVERLDPDVGEL